MHGEMQGLLKGRDKLLVPKLNGLWKHSNKRRDIKARHGVPTMVYIIVQIVNTRKMKRSLAYKERLCVWNVCQ